MLQKYASDQPEDKNGLVSTTSGLLERFTSLLESHWQKTPITTIIKKKQNTNSTPLTDTYEI